MLFFPLEFRTAVGNPSESLLQVLRHGSQWPFVACILLLSGLGCERAEPSFTPPPSGFRPIATVQDGWDSTPSVTSQPSTEKILSRQRAIVRDNITPVEEPTETFSRAANDMAGLLLVGNAVDFADAFADPFDGMLFPETSGPRRPLLKWIDESTWVLPASQNQQKREDLRKSAENFLKHFSNLEDLRLKVTQSHWDESASSLTGSLTLKAQGRNAKKERESIKGEARFEATPASSDFSRWNLRQLQWTSFTSQIARRDYFHEVAAPAGLDTPPPMQPGNRLISQLETMSQSFNGAAVSDVDRDGFLDLYVAGKNGCHLYLNQGNGLFVDHAKEARIAHPIETLVSTVPLFTDVDNDGDADLFVAGVGVSRLYENRVIPDGRLVFRDISEKAGFSETVYSYTANAGDVNGDGWVDFYVTSYNNFPWVLPDSWARAKNGTNNLLYLNQRDGTFKEVAQEWGVAGGRWTFASQMGDIDEDGDLDIYVANDYGSGSTLYRNVGDHFEDAGEAVGLFDRGAGMGVNFGDYNNDGHLDVHVTNMSSSAGSRIFQRFTAEELPDLHHFRKLVAGNMLFANNGDGTFQEISTDAGPFPGGWAWGGGFVDIDNDGWEDLHTPNGFMSGKSIHDT